jgi:ATP-dependent DNA helicase RecG
MCDFNRELEVSKPKSWLKSVSAFANGVGGVLLYGITNDKEVIGLPDVQRDIDIISKQIKERITPLPEIELRVIRTGDGKDVLVVEIMPGAETPYFYSADGSLIAFVRVGSDSVPAPPNRLRELVMKGKNITFDSLSTEYKQSDLTFAIFEAEFKKLTKKVLTPKEYISFGLRKPDGILTYAGLVFADDSPLFQSRVFCTHWNGLDKSGGSDDAVDSEEFEGDLISLLKNSHNFVRLNSKVRWKKMSDHRVNKPDYADRAVFEALANALMHRDYSVIGSEVHVDMYDDRLDIYSPGGMVDGSLIQNLNIEDVPSLRRNPIIAEIFHRLDYIERQGSGLRKIRTETSYLYGYTEEFAPQFISTPTAFHVVLKNMDYGVIEDSQSDIANFTLDFTIENDELLKQIHEQIRKSNSVTAEDLSVICGVGIRTIRRDLDILKNAEKIKRVNGNRYGHWEITNKGGDE